MYIFTFFFFFCCCFPTIWTEMFVAIIFCSVVNFIPLLVVKFKFCFFEASSVSQAMCHKHALTLSVVALQHLASLTFIDLSFNMITEFECAHAKMGNVKTLILASNKLSSLHGLEKLYSLETLNVSNNLISEVNSCIVSIIK